MKNDDLFRQYVYRLNLHSLNASLYSWDVWRGIENTIDFRIYPLEAGAIRTAVQEIKSI